MPTATDHDLRGAIAYSYTRFSDPSQSKGHSSERQHEYAPLFCEENGCTLDASLSFDDEGRSAFHGKHLAAGGGLSRFLACIEAGRVREGDILIVENLDRMSRLPLEDAEDLLKSILSQGVKIHTRSPWAIYDRATLNDPMQRMAMIFEFTRSHRESKYKQERLGHRWISNRKNIRAGEYHLATVPGWLRAKRDGSKVVGYEIIPEHAATVRQIFQLCLDGFGLMAICKKLNQESVPTFGRAKQWGKSSIGKILNNRAVLGEYQPHTVVKHENREFKSVNRRPAGDPVPDHYPRIISDETFDAARLAQEKRRNNPGGIGAHTVTNLFAGLLRDARNGSRMQVVDKGNGPQIVASDALAGTVEGVYVPYEILEQAFVTFAYDMPLDMVMPKDTKRLDKSIAELRKDAESLELQIKKLREKTRVKMSDALLDLLVERDTELKQTRLDIEKLERQRGSSATVAAGTTKQLLDKLANADDSERTELRIKLRNELQFWLKQVTVLPLNLGGVKACMVDAELTNGEHIEFRAAAELIDWPAELDGRSILDWDQWPKGIRKTHWEVEREIDRRIRELDDTKMPVAMIANEVGLHPSKVSSRLIAMGRRRAKRTVLGGDRLMTWNAAANGWQRRYNGKRYYIGAGKLQELYPRLVKERTEKGTQKAANRWWKDHGGK